MIPTVFETNLKSWWGAGCPPNLLDKAPGNQQEGSSILIRRLEALEVCMTLIEFFRDKSMVPTDFEVSLVNWQGVGIYESLGNHWVQLQKLRIPRVLWRIITESSLLKLRSTEILWVV